MQFQRSSSRKLFKWRESVKHFKLLTHLTHFDGCIVRTHERNQIERQLLLLFHRHWVVSGISLIASSSSGISSISLLCAFSLCLSARGKSHSKISLNNKINRCCIPYTETTHKHAGENNTIIIVRHKQQQQQHFLCLYEFNKFKFCSSSLLLLLAAAAVRECGVRVANLWDARTVRWGNGDDNARCHAINSFNLSSSLSALLRFYLFIHCEWIVCHVLCCVWKCSTS
jgi:hypothetical protein